mgnify:FL=1
MITQQQRDIMYKGLAVTGRIAFDADEYAKIEAGLAVDPSDYFLWCARGVMSTDLDVSIESYSRALALRPLSCNTLYNRARKYMSLGRYIEATADFALSTLLDPDDGWKWHFYGVALYFTSRLEEAARAFEKAIAANEKNGLPLLPFDAEWQWNCYCKAGDLEAAQRCIAGVTVDTPVVETESTYKRRILLYRGLLTPEEFLAGIDESDRLEAANQRYGLANYYYYLKKDTAMSLKYLDEVLAIQEAALCWGYKMAALDRPLRQSAI